MKVNDDSPVIIIYLVSLSSDQFNPHLVEYLKSK